jgi:hypothetical protein
MPLKDTRRLAGDFKNSTYNFNRFITRENILLGLLIKISEKFRSRFLNIESREILIPSDSDRKFSFQDKSQSSLTDTGKDGSIMTVPKFILFLPGILGIPHFTGTDITNFFINYRNMCENYNIKKKKRVRRYSRYCTEYITVIVRGLTSFIEPD